MSNPKDPFGRHEALDRTHVVHSTFDSFVLELEFLTEDERVIAVSISSQMAKLYQLIGQNILNDEVLKDRGEEK